VTENAGLENETQSKLQGWKMQDWNYPAFSTCCCLVQIIPVRQYPVLHFQRPHTDNFTYRMTNSPQDTNISFKYRHNNISVECNILNNQTNSFLKLLHISKNLSQHHCTSLPSLTALTNHRWATWYLYLYLSTIFKYLYLYL